MIERSKIPEIDIIVHSIPTHISFECAECLTEIEIPYNEFTATHGDPCDWYGDEIECPECGKKYEIDAWEFT